MARSKTHLKNLSLSLSLSSLSVSYLQRGSIIGEKVESGGSKVRESAVCKGAGARLLLLLLLFSRGKVGHNEIINMGGWARGGGGGGGGRAPVAWWWGARLVCVCLLCCGVGGLRACVCARGGTRGGAERVVTLLNFWGGGSAFVFCWLCV